MRKLLPFISFVLIMSFSTAAKAQESSPDYKLGLGIRLSNQTPTLSNAVSAKYFSNNGNAIEGLLSFGSHFGIGGLYEVHKPLNAIAGLKWYYGAGAYIGFGSGNTYTGPTGVIGLDYKFEKIPLNLSLDWKPELDILPKINFIPDAFGLSARFTLQ
ncbi:MAG: hypothetical protein H7Y27_05600 [Gemmatimonadaceae bacterium]|nr:hypothetical protein [Chitinophagaceae bacterium]